MPRFALFTEGGGAVADVVQAPATEVAAAIQGFVDLRKRQALTLMIDGEELAERHLFEVDRVTLAASGSLDLLIDSSGGAPDVAFEIVQLLRQRFTDIHACVPYWAKSAATLLCLGSDRILVGDLAQLGPLDTQVTETLDTGDKHPESALEEINTLQQLRDFAAETFDIMVNRIRSKSEMELDEAMKQANAFVAATIAPLIEKLDPSKLGEHSRALVIATAYGDRILQLVTDWDADRRAILLHRLVYEYPSHGFAIGYDELISMGLAVERFGPEEMQAVRALYPYLGVKGPRVLSLTVPAVQAPVVPEGQQPA